MKNRNLALVIICFPLLVFLAGYQQADIGEIVENEIVRESEDLITEKLEKEEHLPYAFVSISDISNLTRSSNNAYYIYGATSDNCSKIIVEFQNGDLQDKYQLQNYKYGDTAFKYGVREDWGNLEPNVNHYAFNAYCDNDQQIKSTKISINYTPAISNDDTENEPNNLSESLQDRWDDSIKKNVDTLTELSADPRYLEWLSAIGLSPSTMMQLSQGRETYINNYVQAMKTQMNDDVAWTQNLEKFSIKAEEDWNAKTRMLREEQQRIDDANKPINLGNMVNDNGEWISVEENPITGKITTRVIGTGYPIPYFHGYRCLLDCSGHQAGYDWAEDRGIDNSDNCGGNSQSFIEGCIAYVVENCRGSVYVYDDCEEGDYCYGEDDCGNEIEIYAYEVDGDYGYGEDGDGNEVEFYIY